MPYTIDSYVKPAGNGSYKFRMAVPKALHAVFGKTEFKETFEASNPKNAEAMGWDYVRHYKGLIKQAKSGVAVTVPVKAKGNSNIDRVNAKANDFIRLKRQVSSSAFEDPADDRDEHDLSRDYYKMRSADFDVEAAVSELFAKANIVIPADSNLFKDALEMFKPFHLADMATKIKSHKVAKANALNPNDLQTFERDVLAITDKPLSAPAPRLSEIYAAFLDEPAHHHIRDDKDERDKFNNVINSFIESQGDMPVNYIRRAQSRRFFNELSGYPKRRDTKSMKMTFPEVLAYHADKPGETLTTRTMMVWKRTLKRVFAFAIDEFEDQYDMKLNPFDLSSKYIRGRESVDKRNFRAHELTALFSDSIFQGTLDHRAWLLLLLLFHGARNGEWANKELSTVQQDPDTGIWYLGVGQTKTKAGDRLVPIHDFIIRIGFIEKWVLPLRAKGEKWLFPQFKRGGKLIHGVRHKSKNPSDQFSQWAGRFIDRKIGSDPTVSLHSFRHTWVTTATELEISREWRKAMVGHAASKTDDQEIHDNYTHLTRLGPKKAEIDKIVFTGFPYDQFALKRAA